jgi:hypothetical protein
MGEHQIPVGDKKICDFCDDLMTKIGYLQINDNFRFYRDGSIRNIKYEIKDVLTGRIN